MQSAPASTAKTKKLKRILKDKALSQHLTRRADECYNEEKKASNIPELMLSYQLWRVAPHQAKNHLSQKEKVENIKAIIQALIQNKHCALHKIILNSDLAATNLLATWKNGNNSDDAMLLMQRENPQLSQIAIVPIAEKDLSPQQMEDKIRIYMTIWHNFYYTLCLRVMECKFFLEMLPESALHESVNALYIDIDAKIGSLDKIDAAEHAQHHLTAQTPFELKGWTVEDREAKLSQIEQTIQAEALKYFNALLLESQKLEKEILQQRAKYKTTLPLYNQYQPEMLGSQARPSWQ